MPAATVGAMGVQRWLPVVPVRSSPVQDRVSVAVEEDHVDDEGDADGGEVAVGGGMDVNLNHF